MGLLGLSVCKYITKIWVCKKNLQIFQLGTVNKDYSHFIVSLIEKKNNKMNEGPYPLTEELFKALVESIIEKNYVWKGRPPNISHYQVFCAILYILRTGQPWRD